MRRHSRNWRTTAPLPPSRKSKAALSCSGTQNGALPLQKGASVTLFGQNSFENPDADTTSMGFGYTGPTYGPFYSYHTPGDTSTVKWVTYLSAMQEAFDVNPTGHGGLPDKRVTAG